MVYFFYGTEPYIQNYELSKIVGDAKVISASSFTREVKDYLNTVSLFGRNVLVLKYDTLGAEETLLTYLTNHFPIDNDLVIMAEGCRKTKLLKFLRTKAKVKKCDKMKKEELISYCHKSCKKLKFEITSEAIITLIERSGYLVDDDINLYKINIYMKQLSFHGRFIDRKEVELIVPRYAGDKAFQLLTLILKENRREAFILAETLLIGNKNSPIMSYGAMLRNLRIAYKASLYPELNTKELGELLGLSYFQMNSIQDVRQVTDDTILLLMGLLQKATGEIKEGHMPAEDSFIQTIGNMCLIVEKTSA